MPVTKQKIKQNRVWTGEKAQHLRELAALQRTGVWFLALTAGSSQPAVTEASENWTSHTHDLYWQHALHVTHTYNTINLFFKYPNSDNANRHAEMVEVSKGPHPLTKNYRQLQLLSQG